MGSGEVFVLCNLFISINLLSFFFFHVLALEQLLQ